MSWARTSRASSLVGWLLLCAVAVDTTGMDPIFALLDAASDIARIFSCLQIEWRL